MSEIQGELMQTDYLFNLTKEQYDEMQDKIHKLELEKKELPIVNPNIVNLLMKIQQIKVDLQKKELKKSGFNSFAKFYYYTLEDFLPFVNELCLQYKVYLKEDFEHIKDGYASMTAIDCDDFNNQYIVTIPSTSVDLKGGNAIQNIASQITYSRRHLYLVLLGIVESDMIDAASGKETKDNKTVKSKKTDISEEDDNKTIMKTMCTELSKNGKKDEVMKILMDNGGVKNPNSITDDKKIIKIIEELKKLEA
jgi:hypothetical protein